MGKKKAHSHSEQSLRRVILAPALRMLSVAHQFFRQGKSYREIAAQTGLTPQAVHCMIHRIRKAVERMPGEHETYKAKNRIKYRRDLFEQGGYQIKIRKHDRDAETWAFNDKLLHEIIVAPSLLRYRIAEAYWIKGMLACEVAQQVGLSLKQVQDAIQSINSLAADPMRRRKVFISRPGPGRHNFKA